MLELKWPHFLPGANIKIRVCRKHWPEHCSWERIWAPSNWWLTIFRFGLMQRIKLEPWRRRSWGVKKPERRRWNKLLHQQHDPQPTSQIHDIHHIGLRTWCTAPRGRGGGDCEMYGQDGLQHQSWKQKRSKHWPCCGACPGEYSAGSAGDRGGRRIITFIQTNWENLKRQEDTQSPDIHRVTAKLGTGYSTSHPNLFPVIGRKNAREVGSKLPLLNHFPSISEPSQLHEDRRSTLHVQRI